jgi:hypothetical protein
MAPGSPLVPPDEQLVALWRNRGGQRFQNYRATFTVLDANPHGFPPVPSKRC